MSGHGHSGANAAIGFGNPGSGDSGEVGHSAHSHERGQGGTHEQHGGRGRSAISFSHNHGQKFHFSMQGVSDASPDGDGVDAAAVDRITCPVTYQQSVACGTEPTRVFLTHVVNHSVFRHAYEFSRRALRMGLVRLDTRIPNMDGANERSAKIMSWHAWVVPNDKENMPDGWMEGFTGETFLIRQYWGIGVYDKRYGEVGYDRLARMILEVSWVVWRYDQTAVFETKQTIRVVPYWIYDKSHGAYGFKVKEFDAHQRVAWRLSVGMFEALKQAEPDAGQKVLLDAYGVNVPRHDEGAYPGSLVDESELINEQLKEDRQEDLDKAKEAQGTIDGAFVPPPTPDSGPPDISGTLEDGEDGFPDPTDFVVAPMGIVASGADLINLFPDGAPPAPAPQGTGEVEVTVVVPKLTK